MSGPTKVKTYPQNRRREFIILGAVILYFIGGFFWIPPLVVWLFPRQWMTLAGGLILCGNIMLISVFSFRRADRYRVKLASDYAYIAKHAIPITEDDLRFIQKQELSIELHSVEARWEKGQAKRPPDHLYAEFQNVEDWMTFRLARR